MAQGVRCDVLANTGQLAVALDQPLDGARGQAGVIAVVDRELGAAVVNEERLKIVSPLF